jgi:LPXTG-motif cell wall-anchored protein
VSVSGCAAAPNAAGTGEAMNVWEMVVIAAIVVGGVYYFMKRK